MKFKNKNDLIQDIIKNPEEINIFSYFPQFNVDIDDIPYILFKNREVAYYFCSSDPNHLQDFTKFQDNEDFINSLLTEYPFDSMTILKHSSNRIKSLESIALTACNQDINCLNLVNHKFYDNEYFIKNIFSNFTGDSSSCWSLVAKNLSHDKNFVLEILKENQNIYPYLHDSLKSDSEIINITLQSYHQYKNLPDKEKQKLKYMNLACKNSGMAIEHFPEHIKDNAQIMSYFLNKYPGAIHWSGSKLKNDLDIANLVCSKKLIPSPYIFFNNRIRQNKSIALMSIKNDFKCAQNMPAMLKNNKKFLLSLIDNKVNIQVIEFFSNEIKNNDEFMFSLFKKVNAIASYIGEDLKKSNQFIEQLIEHICEDGESKFSHSLRLETLFKALNLNEKEIPIFKIFSDKIDNLGLDDMNKQASIRKMITSLPQSDLKIQLLDGNCSNNLKSVILQYNLEKQLTHKPSNSKIKI